MMGTGQNASHMVVGSLDQKKFYTANIASDSVTAIELQNAPPAPSKITQIAVGKQPEAIDLSPDGKEVWVGLNAEGAIDIVDTTTNKFKEKVKLGERPYRVKFTPDGKTVVATMPNTKELIVWTRDAQRNETNQTRKRAARHCFLERRQDRIRHRRRKRFRFENRFGKRTSYRQSGNRQSAGRRCRRGNVSGKKNKRQRKKKKGGIKNYAKNLNGVHFYIGNFGGFFRSKKPTTRKTRSAS
jgi:YVTN family beta-propeller protein